jgi:dihydrofolate synthase/folylpolyglutamate synthase
VEDSTPVSRTLDQWLEHQQRTNPREIVLGLERVSVVASKLGLTRPARCVITIGGTNGKGSTVAFVEAIARAAGHRVGAFTSPHLLRYNERIRIEGESVDTDDLIGAFERIEAARGDVPLTYFEYGTLAALLLFERAGLDLAVLEVGLGGRLDAVNLVDPDAAVVTTVALDHMEYLGNDRETIGAEKAGIFRSGRPAIVAELSPPDSLVRHGERLGARMIRAGRDYRWAERLGGKWQWQDGEHRIDLNRPRLAAPAQLANASAAIAALRALGDVLPVSDEHVAVGVAVAQIPARLQRVPGDVEILVDVAHNPQAAQQLAQWMMRNRAMGATQAVFAALSDKDVPNMVGALLGCIDQWRLAGLTGAGPRSQDIDQLWRRVSGLMSRTLSSRHEDVASALRAARLQAHPGDRILVFGSFHTAGQALRELQADGTLPD